MAEMTNGPDERAGMPPAHRPGEEDPDAIRADIGETRRRMSHALDEIGDRINPQHLKEEVKHHVRDATIGRAETMARNTAGRAREARHTIMDTIRDNPLPAAITGLGLGWLVWNGRRNDSEDDRYRYTTWGDEAYLANRPIGTLDDRYATGRYRETSTDFGEGIKDRAEDITDRTREAMQDARDRTRDKADELAHRAHDFAERTAAETRSAAHRIAEETRYRSHRLEDRFQDTMRSNPLAIGAAAAAVGVAVGLSAPATRRESEIMGDARDRFRDRAKHATREAAEKVTHVAEEAVHQAEIAARETAKQEGLTD
jgi:ElaB/YqjD/DUF883 family membrane-anchored ribosome-binding protein